MLYSICGIELKVIEFTAPRYIYWTFHGICGIELKVYVERVLHQEAEHFSVHRPSICGIELKGKRRWRRSTRWLARICEIELKDGL